MTIRFFSKSDRYREFSNFANYEVLIDGYVWPTTEHYYQAQKFAGAFDPNCYLYLSHASDLFDLAEYGGSLEAGFRRIRLDRALVIGVKTDLLFPIEQQRELSVGLGINCPDSKFVELDCLVGHDSFLVDMDAFRPVICDFLC